VVTIRQLLQEQRRRASGNPAERFAAALLIPGALAKRLPFIGDPELGMLLEDEVCPNLSLLLPDATICMEAARRLCQSRTTPIRAGGIRSWKTRLNDGEHILHAEAALYRAGIPHLLLPFQRDRFASNVFMVPSVPDAQQALSRAGFRHGSNSPSLLIDLETGRPIRLFENRT